MTLSAEQKTAVKKIVDGSIKTEADTLKLIHFLIGGGSDDTHGAMGWTIFEKIAQTSPECRAFISALPDRQPATQNDIGEYVYQILNERIF